MLISDSHKLILMLPEKCGTGTLQLRLKDIHDVKEYGKQPYYNEEIRALISKHIPLKQAHKLSAFQERSHYLKACFVRNPYDRVYSWFSWLAKTNEQQIEKLQTARAQGNREKEDDVTAQRLKIFTSLRQQLESADYEFNKFVHDKPTRFKPASKYTHLKKSRAVDFIGRIESFEQDFSDLCRAINYTPKSEQRGNVLHQSTISNNYREQQSVHIGEYDRSTIRLINRVHSADFSYFNYKKISPWRRIIRSK